MGCSAWVPEYTAVGQDPKWVQDHTGLTTFEILPGQQVTIRNKEAEICLKPDSLQLNILKIPQLSGHHHKEKEASRVFVQECANAQTQIYLVNNSTPDNVYQLSKNQGWGKLFKHERFMVKYEDHGVYIRVGGVGIGRVWVQNPPVGVGGSADALTLPVLLKRYETRYLVEGSILKIGDKKFTVKSVLIADSRDFWEPSLDAEGKQKFKPCVDKEGNPRLDEDNKPIMMAIWNQGDKGKPKSAPAPKRKWIFTNNEPFQSLSKTGVPVTCSLGQSHFTVHPAQKSSKQGTAQSVLRGYSKT